MTENRTTGRALTLLAALLALCFSALALYYTVGPAAGEFHADCTDSLYWANASYESGQLVSDDFCYSALLPFGGQLIFLPMIALFGLSMAAQVAGMVVFLLLFIAAMLFLFRSLGWSWGMSFFSLSLVLMIFSLSEKLREMFFGHIIYYSLGILLFAVLLGLLLRFLRASDEKNRRGVLLWGLLGAAFSAAVATDGLQIIVISILPILFALMLERLFDGGQPLLCDENRAPAQALCGILCGCCAGYLLLKLFSHGVTAAYAEGYSTYDAMADWGENLLSLPQRYFSLLGVEISQRDPLFSVASVGNVLRIAAGLALLLLPLLLLFRYRRLRERGTRLLLLAHLFVSAFVLFGFVFGNLHSAAWRLIPMLGTALFCSLAALRELFSGEIVARRLSALFSALLLLVSFLSAGGVLALSGAQRENESLYELADYLGEQGLTYGYADYWEAQALSVIAGPDLRVRDVVLDDDGNLERYYYQSSAAWYEDQPGVERYFVLLDATDYFNYIRSDDCLALDGNILSRETVGEFHIVVFDTNPLN